MKYIIGKDRNQVEFYNLEQLIGHYNEVRLIDLFIDSLPLFEYGFAEPNQSSNLTNPILPKLLTLNFEISLNRLKFEQNFAI